MWLIWICFSFLSKKVVNTCKLLHQVCDSTNVEIIVANNLEKFWAVTQDIWSLREDAIFPEHIMCHQW